MEASLLITSLTDWGAKGFIAGLIALLLAPFLLKPLDLNTTRPFPLRRTVAIYLALLVLPAGIVLVLFDYLACALRGDWFSPVCGFAQFAFVAGVAPSVKFFLNWRNLPHHVRIVLPLEVLAFVVLIGTSFGGVELVTGAPFNSEWLAGSLFTFW